MKKTLWVTIVALLIVSVITASAQEVLSANAIGYIKKELPPGGDLITVSIPLFNMTMTENVFSNLSLADEVPLLSEAYFWDAAAQRWTVGAKKAKGGWDSNINTQLVLSGEFFFLKGPDSATEATEFTLTGELPTDGILTRTVVGGGNLDNVANPYPTDFVFGESSLASNATLLSEASFWNADDQRWNVGAKKAKGGWDANVLTQQVIATEGFFMREAGTVTSWTNSKPYTWP